MPTLINLVATRCLDGDHAMLFRWYNDHVHLLMGCDALQAATLFRRSAGGADDAPEYLCLYEFPSHADFMLFETSEARARAQAVVRSGWASTGIHILQRTQYQRLGRQAGPPADGDYRIALVALGPASGPDTARWVNDRMHATWTGTPGERAWHRAWGADDAGGDVLVLGQGGDAQRAENAISAWKDSPADPEFGASPASVQVRWQAAYGCLRRWSR